MSPPGAPAILNMTLSQRWGRLFVSIGYALRNPDHGRAPPPSRRCAPGWTSGIRTLATVATIDTATGAETVIEYTESGPAESHPARPRRRAGR